MDLLPTELLHQIALHLPPSDLPNYRLISRLYASIGADLLFENFLFQPTDASTARTASILASTIKKCVKVLDYEGSGGDWSVPQKVTHFLHVVAAFLATHAPIDTLGALNLRIEVFADFPACAHLATFDVRFECLDAPTQTQTQRSLRAFLAQLTQLQNLALGFRGAAAPVWLRDVVPAESVWVRLKHVQVEDVCVTEEEFSALLANHARTLRSVYFRDLVMGEGTWRGVFGRLGDMEKLEWAGINEVEQEGCARADGEEWRVERRGGELVVKTNLRRWLNDKDGEV
jgi:hypothetical protein